MSGEKQITMASQLYKIRRLLRGVLGDEKYQKLVSEYRPILERVQGMQQCDTLQAATWLAKRVDPTDGAEIMRIMAAAVEMIEPSSVTQGVNDGN